MRTRGEGEGLWDGKKERERRGEGCVCVCGGGSESLLPPLDAGAVGVCVLHIALAPRGGRAWAVQGCAGRRFLHPIFPSKDGMEKTLSLFSSHLRRRQAGVHDARRDDAERGCFTRA